MLVSRVICDQTVTAVSHKETQLSLRLKWILLVHILPAALSATETLPVLLKS